MTVASSPPTLLPRSAVPSLLASALLALGLLVALWIGVATGTGLAAADPGVLAAVVAGRPPALVAVAHVVTDIGAPEVTAGATVLVLAWWAWRGARRDAVVGVVGLAALAVADLGVKTVVGRPRPPVAWHAVVAHGASFPSGHVTLSAGTVLLLAWLARDVGSRAARCCAVAVAAVFLLAVGASRVVLGVHYPDDVVAGWAIAVLVVSVVALVDVAVGRKETQVNG